MGLARARSHVRNNLVGYIALLVAVVGVPVTWAVTKNTVGSRDIKPGAVRKSDLAKNSVNSKKVADRSLLSKDFAAGQIPTGPTGPAGSDAQFNGAAAGGALTGSYPNPSLKAPEAVHVVGATGEPAFAPGVTNSGGNFAPAGFYKDGLGRVHLQGTVNTGASGIPIFTLPPGYGPQLDVCFAATAFTAGSALTTNRVCVFGPAGVVENDRGTGITAVNLDGISFRP